jgi:hypothetical protein
VFQDIQPTHEGLKRKPLWIVLFVAAIVCILALIFRPTYNTSTNFPELHFSSSGKIPTKLHIFRLGMTVDEATDQDPTITELGADKGSESKPIANKQNTTLSRGISGSGFYETATFNAGRLIDISSSVSGISPEDASEFNQNTLQQLGTPDVHPSTNVWVWIDGDVRIRYENQAGGSPAEGSRTARLEIVIYPDIIKGLTSAENPSGYNEYVRHSWGEKIGDVVIKRLPTELSGLKLGMTPQQVRSVFPSIRIYSMMNARRQQGQFQDVDVAFWDGLLGFFDRRWESVPDDQISQIRQRLMVELGTPSDFWFDTDAGFQDLTWEDDHTEIEYMFGKTQSAGIAQVTVDCWDKRLQALSDAAYVEEWQQGFTPAPQSHSFF